MVFGIANNAPAVDGSRNMSATAPEISIVLPCLNEALTLDACLKEISKALVTNSIDGEIVVADNGSTDGSQAIAIKHGARLVSVAAKGYGNALRGGFAAARGRYILMGDADGSYDFGHIPRFCERLRAGADLVMGNRFAGGVQPGAMPWKNRYIGNPILSSLGRLFFRTGIRDFHCGLRAFSVDAYRKMDLRTTGMEFATEMVIKAKLLGLRLEEVPTVLRPDGRNRPPHLRPWRDGWRHLRFMLLFSSRWLFLYPGLALMIVGGAVLSVLLRGPAILGGVTFDVHTMLFAAFAILIGFQAVSFAGLGKFFAIRAGLRAPDERFDRMLRAATIEAGLVFGALLFIVGLVLSVGAVYIWGRHHFGELSPQAMLRLVIPGALALTLGCHVALTSLFLGVLRLDTREDRP